MKPTIVTFNCKNLFNRFKLSEKASQVKTEALVQNGFIIGFNLRNKFFKIKESNIS